MKLSFYTVLILCMLFVNACTNEQHSEQNSSLSFKIDASLETNESIILVEDENLSLLVPNKDEPLVQVRSSVEVVKKVSRTPITPNIETYSNLVGSDKNLRLTIKGEINSRVYIENMLYGTIGDNQKLNVELSNPEENYFETFEVFLSNEEGIDSEPLVFTTSFYREAMDGNYTYYIPKNVKLSNYEFNSNMLFTSYPSPTYEVVSLIVPLTLKQTQSNYTSLNALVQSIQTSAFIKDFVSVSSHELEAKRSIVAEYTVSTNKELSSLNVLKLIIFNHFGTYPYLYKDKKSLKAKYFNIKIRLLQRYQGEKYLSIAIVPRFLALKHQLMINRMINSQNIKRNTTKVYLQEETFKAKSADIDEEQSANFLFVIDDSGSMFDYQKAISSVAKEFALAVKNVGMNFKIAIITTGLLNEAFDVVENEGIIENDITLFQRSLRVGTSGSATEAALYNIEKSLASKEYGDKKDGLLTQLNMPRVNENLSIIILSDEPSSYQERAGKVFDIKNNLMVNRGYRVYLIGASKVEERYVDRRYFQHESSDYGVYGELVRKTGGIVQNIVNINSYDTMMNTIVEDVLGDLGYRLRQSNVIESSIYVTVNDEEIPYGDVDGWRYVQSTNSILFSGSFIPDEDDIILIRYAYVLE